MKTFLTAILIFILAVTFIFGGLFYFFLNTSAGFETLINTVWNQALPQNKLLEFHISKVRTNPIRGIEISGLKMKVLIDGIKTQIKAGELGCELHPSQIFQSPIFWADKLIIKNDSLSLLNVDINLGLKPMQATPTGYGSVSIEKIKLQPNYELNNIRGIITSLDPIIIRPLQGSALSGLIEAEFSMKPKEGRLIIKGQLIDADMALLQKVAGDNFKNSKGKFRGEFNIETEKDSLKSVWIQAESPSPGGEMNADLFRILLDYLPSNADKKLIQDLIQTRKALPFDEARFTLKNVSEKSFQGQFNFSSKTLNVKLNVVLTVNFEDIEIMKSISNLMQMMGGIQNADK